MFIQAGGIMNLTLERDFVIKVPEVELFETEEPFPVFTSGGSTA